MSGHSKWATIKRAKGAADLKRGLTFTKISNAITIAVRTSGGITDINVERAIQKAVGKNAGFLSEVLYEGFAPEGVSVIIEAATDNTLRTTSEIKSIFNKGGGNFSQPGSVAYQFEQKGIIVVNKNGKTIDELFEAALESGAEDIEDTGDKAVVETSFANLSKVREALAKKGITAEKAEIVRKPLMPITISDEEKLNSVVNFLDKLEELDDVQKVYSNLASNQ